MEIVIKICSVIGVLLTVLTAYKLIFIVVGFFKKKTFKKTENKHTYAVCISARNEEKVIANLLESIYNQDYPKDKLTVFIVAHNCTDRTSEIARQFAQTHPDLPIVVYDRNSPDERTKGYALQFLFEQIEIDYKRSSFEGYFIFDADNLLNKNYVTKMNEAFDEGNKIITSFRNSKNFHQNWISFGYALHWARTCLKENRAKAVLNQACRIQGTGFLFSNELVKDGWKYTTLTEDRSFCSDAVVQGYRITYCDDAIFYDEQPYKLKVALRQRLRWAKGHLQSTVENCPKLLKNMFRKDKYFPTTYDCFWLNFPRSVESGARKIIRFTMEMIIAILAGTTLGWFKGLLIAYLYGWIERIVGAVFEFLVVYIVYRKRISTPPPMENLLSRSYVPVFLRHRQMVYISRCIQKS